MMGLMQARTSYFRHRANGSVHRLSVAYSNPLHPFHDQFEELGDEYEDNKVVVEAGPPAKSADKATWTAYALESGFDVPDGMTKNEIVALIEADAEDGEG